jgi:hypothetical protein
MWPAARLALLAIIKAAALAQVIRDLIGCFMNSSSDLVLLIYHRFDGRFVIGLY